MKEILSIISIVLSAINFIGLLYIISLILKKNNAISPLLDQLDRIEENKENQYKVILGRIESVEKIGTKYLHIDDSLLETNQQFNEILEKLTPPKKEKKESTAKKTTTRKPRAKKE